MTTKVAQRAEVIFRSAGASPALAPARVATNQHLGAVRRVPMFIPADQAYYWSAQWQRDEAESLANLKAGNARTFEDPMDAIRHLLSDD